MAKVELRKPISTLIDEKNKIDQQLTSCIDEYNRYAEELQRLRSEQFSYREAKEHLPNNHASRPAKLVFDNNIAVAQKRIDEIMKLLDEVEKQRVVVTSKSKALDTSIKQLQNA